MDKYLGIILQKYGVLSYFVLFLIIFSETGLVVTPFLPGDSLLFVAGTFAAIGLMNPIALFFILSLAAILGDALNYSIGSYFGRNFLFGKNIVKGEYLERTERFYRRYGGKAIILARFVPVIRTFAPFVAGVGKMDKFRFFAFNILGSLMWVGLFVFGGYFFGGIPLVEKNLNYAIMIIILVSVIPIIAEFLRKK